MVVASGNGSELESMGFIVKLFMIIQTVCVIIMSLLYND